MLLIYISSCTLNHKKTENSGNSGKCKMTHRKYKWEQKKFPCGRKDCNIFDENNPSVSVNVFFIDKKEEGKEREKIKQAYISK